MNKIISFFILIITLYIILIFKSPDLASKIWNTLWIQSFNEFINSSKWNIDQISNNVPTADEIVDTYNKTLSWAIELRDNIQDWIIKTKDTIDWVRSTINDTKEVIDQTKETIDSTINTVNELKDTVDSITDTLTSTWETN